MTNLPLSRPRFVAVTVALAALIYTLALAVGHIPGTCFGADCWFPYLGIRLWAFGSLLTGLIVGLFVAGLDTLAVWGSRRAG